jgi:CheY-like chemotaxis protein
MSDTSLVCPYCGRVLEWVPQQWLGRASFACQRCGEFPDLGTQPVVERSLPKRVPASAVTTVAYHEGRPRVLLVDDSAEYRDLYAMMLEATATVTTASRGEDALIIARLQPLDAIVLDVMMPGMDGWRTCESLKASPLTSGIPVILLTSLDGRDVPARAERVGAASVLIKPCSAERLSNAIASAVQRRFGGARRWPRKAVKAVVAARVGNAAASIVNLSYGGLCMRVEGPPPAGAAPIRLLVPEANLSMHADAVWTTAGAGELWVCGAELLHASDTWRILVDTVS